VHEDEVRAALHHFVGGDRGIESAREQADHLPAGFRRQAARAGNLPRVDERRAGRNLHAAGAVRRTEVHARFAAGLAQAGEQMGAHRALDFRATIGEGFVAALGADGERGESLVFHFVPGGGADGVEIALHGLRGSEVGDAEHALDALQGLGRIGTLAEPDEDPVARTIDAVDRQAFEAPLEGFGQPVEKEEPVAALEPQFVVVDDDGASRHRRRRTQGSKPSKYNSPPAGGVARGGGRSGPCRKTGSERRWRARICR